MAYNNRYTNLIWGGEGTLIGANDNGIGFGRIDTNTAIGSAADVSGSIWELIRTIRADKLNGCDDWYIPNVSELNQIYTNQVTPMYHWFIGVDIWTSFEKSNTDVWYWSNMKIEIVSGSKSGNMFTGIPNTIVIRSF